MGLPFTLPVSNVLVDEGAPLKFTAKLLDGAPLPPWLTFRKERFEGREDMGKEGFCSGFIGVLLVVLYRGFISLWFCRGFEVESLDVILVSSSCSWGVRGLRSKDITRQER